MLRRRFTLALMLAALPTAGLVGWLAGTMHPTASAQSPLPALPQPAIVVPVVPQSAAGLPASQLYRDSTEGAGPEFNRFELTLDVRKEDGIELTFAEYADGGKILSLDLTATLGNTVFLNTLLRRTMKPKPDAVHLTVRNSDGADWNEKNRHAIRKIVNALIVADRPIVRYYGPLPSTVTYDLHLVETNIRQPDGKLAQQPAVRDERILSEVSEVVKDRIIDLRVAFDERYRKHEPKLPPKEVVGLELPMPKIAVPAAVAPVK